MQTKQSLNPIGDLVKQYNIRQTGRGTGGRLRGVINQITNQLFKLYKADQSFVVSKKQIAPVVERWLGRELDSSTGIFGKWNPVERLSDWWSSDSEKQVSDRIMHDLDRAVEQSKAMPSETVGMHAAPLQPKSLLDHLLVGLYMFGNVANQLTAGSEPDPNNAESSGESGPSYEQPVRPPTTAESMTACVLASKLVGLSTPSTLMTCSSLMVAGASGIAIPQIDKSAVSPRIKEISGYCEAGNPGCSDKVDFLSIRDSLLAGEYERLESFNTKDVLASINSKEMIEKLVIEALRLNRVSKNSNISKAIIVLLEKRGPVDNPSEVICPIHEAVYEGDLEVVRCLVKNGWPIRKKAVKLALHNYAVDMLKELVHHLCAKDLEDIIAGATKEELHCLFSADIDFDDPSLVPALHRMIQNDGAGIDRKDPHLHFLFSLGYTNWINVVHPETQRTALEECVVAKKLNLLRILLATGADTKTRGNGKGGTILHLAVETGNQEVVAEILATNPVLSTHVDDEGLSPLELALKMMPKEPDPAPIYSAEQRDRIAIIKLLKPNIEEFAKLKLWKAANIHYGPAAFKTLDERLEKQLSINNLDGFMNDLRPGIKLKPEYLKAFIERAYQDDINKFVAIVMAKKIDLSKCEANYLSMILIDYPENFIESTNIDPSKVDSYGFSLTSYAARKGKIKLLTACLDHGVDIHQKFWGTSDGEFLGSLVDIAASGDDKEVLTLLLERGARFSKDVGAVLLAKAIIAKDKDELTFLLKYGVNPNIPCAFEGHPELLPPLTLAGIYGQVDMIVKLLDAGANLNHVSSFGNTPFMSMIKRGDLNTALYLRDGTDLSIQDIDGNTVVHLAVMKLRENPGMQIVLEDLYSRNPNDFKRIRDIKNAEGKTIEDMAKEQLQAAGILSVDVKDQHGNTWGSTKGDNTVLQWITLIVGFSGMCVALHLLAEQKTTVARLENELRNPRARLDTLMASLDRLRDPESSELASAVTYDNLIQRCYSLGIDVADIQDEDYLCPISHAIMKDPIHISSGQTLDRAGLQEIESRARRSSLANPRRPFRLKNPMTNDFFPHVEVTLRTGEVKSWVFKGVSPNLSLRQDIDEFCKAWIPKLEERIRQHYAARTIQRAYRQNKLKSKQLAT